MKYFVFAIAALGVPPLSFLLYINRWWLKYTYWVIVVAMCFYNSTAINFFSNETYRGSARGMEISLIHLFAFAVLGSLSLGRRIRKWFPDGGFKIYAAYFLLCLPSHSTAADGMVAWFEIWKMLLLYFFYLMVYSYLKATDDVKSVLQGLAAFAVFNMLVVVRDQYFSGVYQPHGVFPHQNSMAVAMQMFGTVFFAAYLTLGMRGGFAKMCFAAFLCAAGATARSFSRMALALMPLAYGITALTCMRRRHLGLWLRRIVPMAIVGALAVAIVMPRVIERFRNAPKSSGDTRVELALCAWEMIKDHPWKGVGINNWGIKINAPYDYAERAGRESNRGEDFQDGIVETVYLLVGAECGLPALVAMLAWFGWYWVACIRLMRRLKGTRLFFLPAGLFGGLTASYLQSCFEWVLRQQLNLVCLMFMFAILSYLNANWRNLIKQEAGENGEKP